MAVNKITEGTAQAGSLKAEQDITAGDDLTVTDDAAVGGELTFKRPAIDTGGAYATPIALTEAQSGSVILVDDAAGLDFTLPALAAAQIGIHFLFLVTVTITSNNFRVTAQAGDLLNGALAIQDFDTANTISHFAADGSDDLILTCNGSTKGGKKGSWVEFIATGANQWTVRGTLFGDGVLATPFS